MTDTDTLREAEAAGIAVHWRDARGAAREVSLAAVRTLLDLLDPGDSRPPPLITADIGGEVDIEAPAGRYQITAEYGEIAEGVASEHDRGKVRLRVPDGPGYHRLEIGGRSIILAVAPSRCWTVADAAPGERLWGLAVQLYALRRAGDGGLGDFRALAKLSQQAAFAGAAAIAISPVHAGFAADPTHFSPYAPSSRGFLNGFHAAPGSELPAPEGGDDLVDWQAAVQLRLSTSRRSFATMSDQLRGEFETFRAERGAPLERHARFEALHSAQLAIAPERWDWHCWPAALHDPHAPAVAEFAAKNAAEVDFHAYLQFLADRGLDAAQSAARAAGMPIGLIADLAIGVHGSGSDAWGQPSQLLNGLNIGAPGDILNPQGQDWGVTTFSPTGLRAHGYAAFLDMLRAALRHAGGVRIDHVMGLARLWVVPHGASSADGAYLRFPLDDLLRLVRLESQRHRAIVIGEDLGTVPEGFRDRLDAAGIAGMRVLWFEREEARFIPPSDWSPAAVAMTTTHDLPTVAGWWTGRDVDWQAELGRGDPAAAAAERDPERAALWAAMRESGATSEDQPPADAAKAVVDAACIHVGSAACALTLLPIEDALGLAEQPNLPGTIDEHPNWRRRLPATVETMLSEPATAARLRALTGARAA